MLHELIYLIDNYVEVKEIELPIGLCIGEITTEILEALCYSKKITNLSINLEAGSDRLLKFIGKEHTCEQARNVFAKIHEANPTVKILTTVMLGLPTENMGDILELAKLILDTRPDDVHTNYFICSPNLPLAKYPQLSEMCREYHFKQFIKYVTTLPIQGYYEFKMECYQFWKRRFSRSAIKERELLQEENEVRKKYGFLPYHLGIIMKIKRGER